MKQSSTFRWVVSLTLAAVLLVTAAAAFQVQPAQASLRTVTLTVDNRAPGEISLSLTGPASYFLKVAGETRKAFTVNQGIYDYTIRGCGMTAKSTLDLTRDTILINPVCGGSIRTIPADNSKIDLSAVIKVVPVKISSELENKTIVIMTGPSTYVFTMAADQEKAVTIGRGTYTVRYYACGVNLKKSFQAYKGAKLFLRCP